jgi:hypothetical protein
MVVIGLVIGFYALLLAVLVYSAASRRRKSRLDADMGRRESDTADAGLPPEARGRPKTAPADEHPEEVSKR